jgi:hypothetical protein
LAYITSSYTYINISYILSQHIGNIDIIIIKTKTHVHHILDLKNMYTHIYIGLSGHPNVYIQKIHRPTGPCRITVQKSAHQPIKKVYKNTSYNQGASNAPPAAPPSEEVVAHPDLPQAVVVEHPQDPPAQAAGVH